MSMRLRLFTIYSAIVVSLWAAGCSTRPTGPQAPSKEPPPQAESPEDQNMAMIAQVKYAHDWMQAINLYASKNGGRCPANLKDAAAYFPDQGTAGNSLAPQQFEIVYQG